MPIQDSVRKQALHRRQRPALRMAEDQDGVNGEEHPPLDISQRKALTQLPKTNHDAAIFKLVRKLRTRYTNLLQIIESFEHGPTYIV